MRSHAARGRHNSCPHNDGTRRTRPNRRSIHQHSSQPQYCGQQKPLYSHKCGIQQQPRRRHTEPLHFHTKTVSRHAKPRSCRPRPVCGDQRTHQPVERTSHSIHQPHRRQPQQQYRTKPLGQHLQQPLLWLIPHHDIQRCREQLWWPCNPKPQCRQHPKPRRSQQWPCSREQPQRQQRCRHSPGHPQLHSIPKDERRTRQQGRQQWPHNHLCEQRHTAHGRQ